MTRPAGVPSLTVVVCTRNRPAMLEHALTSILAHCDPAVEVLVIDSASDDDRTAAVAARAGVRCVRAGRKGLSIARNVGLETATGDVVLYTDDDCQAGPDWYEPLLRRFADRQVGAVSGTMLDPDQELDPRRSGRRFVRTLDGLDAGHGAIMAFDRHAALELGGFDDLLGAGSALPGAEDLDMFCRFLRAGWAVEYEPTGYIHHLNQRVDAAHVALLYGYGLGLGAMAVKYLRIDPALGLHMLLKVGYRSGTAALRQRLRRRPDASSYLAMSRGIVRGAAAGLRLPVRGERFVAAVPAGAQSAPGGGKTAGTGRTGRPADRIGSVVPLSTVDERYLASSLAWQAFRPTATAVLADPPRTADGSLDLEPVRRLATLLVSHHPRLTQHIRLAPFGLHAPVWTEDPAFDLDRHVRLHPEVVDAANIPGRLLAGLENGPMSARHSPWDFLAVDLSDGNMLLVMRIHHVAADGLVGREMFLGLTDEYRVRRHGATWPSLPTPGRPPRSEWEVLLALFARFRAERCDRPGLPGLVAGWLTTPPRDRARRLVARNLRPVRNFWLARRGRDQLHTEPRLVTVPLAPVRQWAKAHHASLSDATAASLAVAIASLGGDGPPVRIMVPVAVRGDAAAKQTNRVKIIVLDLPRSVDPDRVLDAVVTQMSVAGNGSPAPAGQTDGAPASSTGLRPGDWQAYSTFLPGPRRRVTMMDRPVVGMMLWPAMDPRENCAALSLSVVDELAVALAAGPDIDADALAHAVRQVLLEQAGAAR